MNTWKARRARRLVGTVLAARLALQAGYARSASSIAQGKLTDAQYLKHVIGWSARRSQRWAHPALLGKCPETAPRCPQNRQPGGYYSCKCERAFGHRGNHRCVQCGTWPTEEER